MIDVDLLSRYYGKTPAVKQVSFTIDERQIVGLLGHNGAGKTTVMKMLSGYLEPSSGTVHVRGKDLQTHAQEIQARLGYLPENLPVYPEMTIADYMDYAAHLKGLRGNAKSKAIRDSIAATELGARYHDPIGQLSRGFRQRVGVAQAILGEPELLILDEPGNGLDPQQNEHMRALIKNIAERATVILSTHIMQEVDALCDRVLVLSNGELAVDASMESLRESRHLIVGCDDNGVDIAALLAQLPQINSVETLDLGAEHTEYRLGLHEGTAMDTAAGNISQAIVSSGARLFRLTPEERDLEQIFRESVKSTGGHHAV
ncbi:MAG: ABC transporter ATP-binding protein [Congregibacter sp.]